MRIGIDVSQMAYENTGVANYLYQLVDHLLSIDQENEFILFYSSFRRPIQKSKFLPRRQAGKNQNYKSKFKIKSLKLPPKFLDILWNRLHIVPIEWFIGDVDIFISSDWTQPPARNAKQVTVLYDLIVYKYPEETAAKIVKTQKRRLRWVKKECDAILCISEATKKDAQEILGISESKLKVVYPGTK